MDEDEDAPTEAVEYSCVVIRPSGDFEPSTARPESEACSSFLESMAAKRSHSSSSPSSVPPCDAESYELLREGAENVTGEAGLNRGGCGATEEPHALHLDNIQCLMSLTCRELF